MGSQKKTGNDFTKSKYQQCNLLKIRFSQNWDGNCTFCLSGWCSLYFLIRAVVRSENPWRKGLGEAIMWWG